jgi:hypothetical protein
MTQWWHDLQELIARQLAKRWRVHGGKQKSVAQQSQTEIEQPQASLQLPELRTTSVSATTEKHDAEAKNGQSNPKCQ